jgi:acetyl esterase/lipase
MRLTAALALLLLACPAVAQPPPDVAAELARIGRVIAVPPTLALYAPLHGADAAAGLRVERDIAYGADAAQRLDVFAPAAGGAGRPVMLFVPGGGFVSANRTSPGQPAFWGNIPAWAARQGFVGVIMSYRVAPAHRYPAAQEDIGAALAWVAANAARFGGDPARVTVLGQSAGAINAALYAVEPRFHPAGVVPPRGYALVSGLYHFEAEAPPNERAYLGEDAAARVALSPRTGLARLDVPLLIAWGSLNPERFEANSVVLVRTLLNAGRQPVVVPLEGHSHISEVAAIGTADTALTAPLAAFIGR